MKYRIDFGSGPLEVEKQGSGFRVNGQPAPVAVHARGKEDLVLRIGDRLFRIECLERSEDGQTVRARVNGKLSEFRIRSETDLLMEQWSGPGGAGTAMKKIKAPMPGMIVKVSVGPGDEVSKGQVLLNFEAMKMENQLLSPGAGRVRTVLVAAGDKVEKGQVLVEFE